MTLMDNWKETTQGVSTGISESIHISISREHNKYLKDVEDCFRGISVSVKADYCRLSAEELPMQIIIFLGGAVLSGIIYDLLKSGIYKLFSIFKDAQITVRIEHNIMFSIAPDERVLPIVVSWLREKYSHIKTLNDLFSYLQITNKIKQCLEKLYQNDSILFERNKGKGLCERCIVFRFALYLQEVFPDDIVDCDFNSALVNGQDIRGKPIRNSNGKTSTDRFVDIIVHKRTAEANTDFICFEIKKWNNYDKKATAKDKNNLSILTSEYGYQYGFYLIFGRNKKATKWSIFQNGKQLNDEEVIFD